MMMTERDLLRMAGEQWRHSHKVSAEEWLARRCALAEERLAKLVEAAHKVTACGDDYSKEWVQAHEVDDHLCDLDHKDEMELADLVAACHEFSAALREIEAGDA